MAAIIDLCKFTDPSLVAMICGGYVVREFSTVLVRPLDAAVMLNDAGTGIRVEPVGAHEFRSWVGMVVQGFARQDDVPEEQVAMMTSANPWPESLFALFGWLPRCLGGNGHSRWIGDIFRRSNAGPRAGSRLQLAFNTSLAAKSCANSAAISPRRRRFLAAHTWPSVELARAGLAVFHRRFANPSVDGHRVSRAV
jgi:hypothetical protein